MDGYRVLVRDADLKLVGEIDDYHKLEAIPRFNVVGAAILEISASSPKVELLDPQTNPDGGVIILDLDGNVAMSGDIDTFDFAASGDEGDGDGVVKVGVLDDMNELESRLVFPVPTSDIPSQGATAFYEVSGASTSLETLMRTIANMNTGPGALVHRRIPHMTLAPDEGRGTAPDFRYSFRFETVRAALEIIAAAAPTGLSGNPRGGLGFRIVQTLGNQLEFQIYSTVDRVNTAKFSQDLGNLSDIGYTVKRPKASRVILGAGRTAAFTDGPQVAANLVEYERADTLFPGAYGEVFSDAGEIDPAAADVDERLQTSADNVYDTVAGQIGLSLTPIETPSLRYGRDWAVGDIVTARARGLTIQQQVREVHMVSDADNGVTREAVVGTKDGAYARRTPGIYRRLTELSKLMRKKETTV